MNAPDCVWDSLYILDTSRLTYMWFTNTFWFFFLSLHPLNKVFYWTSVLFCFYYSLNFFFQLQLKSNLSIFILWIIILMSNLKNFQLDPEEFLLCLFSKSFIVLYFTFKFIIHFGLIFCKIWGLPWSFLLFSPAMDVQLLQQLLKRLTNCFLHWTAFVPLTNII